MRNHALFRLVCQPSPVPKSAYFPGRRVLACILPALALVSGCGNDFGYLAYQTAESAGRTFFDLLLTEFANQIYDGLTGTNDGDNGNDNQSGDDNENDNSAGDDDGDNDNSAGNGGNDNSSAGPDAVAGEQLYADSCASCHCADASGGCLLDAPSLVGATAQLLEEFVVGDATHPAKRDWSDQNLADVEAYLASLGG